MEKLIDLINEWYQERYKTNPHFNKFEDYWGIDYWYFVWDDNLMVETEVRTKKYGFIKWLVDNDKIDLWKLIMIKDEEQKAIVDIDNSRENTLLMLLAIQDEPIEFLIAILK